MRVHQLAEVAVFGQEHTALVHSAPDDLFVTRAGCNFRDCNYVVAGFAQRLDYRPRATLVGHELHVSRFGRI